MNGAWQPLKVSHSKTNSDRGYKHAVDRDDVIFAYELYLGRKPESEDVIKDKLNSCQSLLELHTQFINSDEFRERIGAGARLNGPVIHVDVDVDESTLNLIFEHVQHTWTELGETEPYWSVLSSDQFRQDNFSSNQLQFFESGKKEVDILRNYLHRNGIQLDELRSCLELGCGVGRVTRWLANQFDEVDAYDISKKHIELAKKYLTQQNINNVHFHVLRNVRDIERANKVDVIFSVIVLQHNPPPVIAYLISRLLEILNPGGIAFIQVPTYSLGYRFDVESYMQEKSQAVEGGIEMHVLPQVRLFQLIEDAGCSLLEIREDGWVGVSGWLSNSVLIQKSKDNAAARSRFIPKSWKFIRRFFWN